MSAFSMLFGAALISVISAVLSTDLIYKMKPTAPQKILIGLLLPTVCFLVAGCYNMYGDRGVYNHTDMLVQYWLDLAMLSMTIYYSVLVAGWIAKEHWLKKTQHIPFPEDANL